MTCSITDTSVDAVARWGNLPLHERIVEALADAMFHADDVLQMIAIDPHGYQYEPVQSDVRDVYDRINAIMRRMTD